MPEARWLAHGALGFVNAIGSGGLGAAAALGLRVEARLRDCGGLEVESRTRGQVLEVEEGILEAVASVASERLGARIEGFCGTVESEVPLEAGLKGSSALVNALLGAALRLHGVEPGLLELARLGVEAARRAGLTVTGALDDHLSTLGCGLYATDNARQLLAVHYSLEGYAAIAAAGRRSIRSISRESYEPYRGLFARAWLLAAQGRPWEAALLNGLAMSMVYGEAWFPRAASRLLERGDVYTAGVSGKSPSIYAVAASREAAAEALGLMEEQVPGEPVLLVAPLLGCGGVGPTASPQRPLPGSAGGLRH